MIINTMTIKNRGKVETYMVKDETATEFKERFIKVHFLNKDDAKDVETIAEPLLSETRKSVFAKITIADNTNEPGEKADKYWMSKERVVDGQKFNARFFIREVVDITLTPYEEKKEQPKVNADGLPL